jgi:hypothetical protein
MKNPLLIAALCTSFGVFMGALGHHYYQPKHTLRVELAPLVVPTAALQAAPPVAVTADPRARDEHACDLPRGPLSGAEVDQLLTEAQTEYVNGDYQRSLELARRGVKDSPIRAWRIIGGTACHLRDARLASDAYRHLDPPGRQYLVYVCRREGLASGPGGRFTQLE